MSKALSVLHDRLSGWFEVSRSLDGKNMLSMEGLRGFAVFLVFLVHYVTLVQPYIEESSTLIRFGRWVHAAGNTGVDLFFVLSGYLIYGSLIVKARPFRTYFLRRLQRIYPAFLAVFAVYIVLSFTFQDQSKIPAEPDAAALYLFQNLLLLPGVFPIEPMITVAWSLSYEMLYYLLIPAVIGLLRLRRWTPAGRIVFFASAAVFLLLVLTMQGAHQRLIMFIAGILLFELMSLERTSTAPAWLGFFGLALGLGVTVLPLSGAWAYAFKLSTLFVCFPLACGACFAAPDKWLARAFSWTPLRWLGNMSYSYYLLHGLALKACFLMIDKVLVPGSNGLLFFLTLLPVTFVATLIASAMLFVAVERPLSLRGTAAPRAVAATA